jgi:hypothetical protein
VADSQCFLRDGWGETENWGVWTVAHRATLSFRVTERRDLVVRALVQPFLTQLYPKLVVGVWAARGEIARWAFDADAPEAWSPQWREARIHSSDIRSEDDALEISLVINAPHSPLSQGLADDARMLGLQLFRLSLS